MNIGKEFIYMKTIEIRINIVENWNCINEEKVVKVTSDDYRKIELKEKIYLLVVSLDREIKGK